MQTLWLWKLLTAVMDYFTYLYKDGAIPLPDDYFGRDDIGH